jgi:hypothetical protein
LILGKIIKNESGDLSFDDRKGISSIVSYFYDAHGINKVEFLDDIVAKVEADTLNKKEAGYNDSYYYRDKGTNVGRSRLTQEGFGFKHINNWQRFQRQNSAAIYCWESKCDHQLQKFSGCH